MKYSKLLLLVFLFVACAPDAKKEVPKLSEAVVNYDWLLGNWKRLNDEEGKSTFEFWDKKSPEEYIGLGYTLEGIDTVFKENLRIIKLQDKWNLEVVGVHDDPVYFEFSSFKKDQFVCENEHNEFPKKIEYHFINKQLEAIVSAGDMEVPFNFEKVTNE